MRILAVRVEGAPRTRTSFLASIISPLLTTNVPFSSPAHLSSEATPPLQTLESVLHSTRRVSDVLLRSDIFSSVQPTLERSRDPLSQPRDVDLVLRCRERSRFFLKTATEIGNNEGTAVSLENLVRILVLLISPSRAQQLDFVTYLEEPKTSRLLSPSALTLGMLSLRPSPCRSRPHFSPLGCFLYTRQNATSRGLRVVEKPLRVLGPLLG